MKHIFALFILREFGSAWLPRELIIFIISLIPKYKILASYIRSVVIDGGNAYIWGKKFTNNNIKGFNPPVKFNIPNIKYIGFVKDLLIAQTFDNKIHVKSFHDKDRSVEFNSFLQQNKINNIQKILCSFGTIILPMINSFYIIIDGLTFKIYHIKESSQILKLKVSSFDVYILNEHGMLKMYDSILFDIADTNPKSRINNFSLPNIINFACSDSHIVIINNNYNAFFWKKCAYSDNKISTLEKISVDNVISVSCANYYTLFLTKSGILYEIGNNDTLTSEYSITYNLSSFIPKKLDIHGILSINAGEYHVVVSTTRGIYTWGSNENGQTGFVTYSENPQLIKYDYF